MRVPFRARRKAPADRHDKSADPVADRETRRREREERRRREAEKGKAERAETAPAAEEGKRKRPAPAPKRRERRDAVRSRVAAARNASAQGLRATGGRAAVLTPHVKRAGDAVGAVLRRALAVFFGTLALVERVLRRVLGAGGRATAAVVARLDSWLTPARAAFAVVVAAGACLVVSQFVDYRGVEVGQPAYADVAAIAAPPQRAKETPVDAHSYALVAVAALAVGVALVALLRRRRRLGRLVALAGLVALAVILLVDMPQGLEEGDASLQYEGAHATLNEGFYAEIAAAGGLILGGLVLSLHLHSDRRPARRRERAGRRRRSRPPKPARLAGSGS